MPTTDDPFLTSQGTSSSQGDTSSSQGTNPPQQDFDLGFDMPASPTEEALSPASPSVDGIELSLNAEPAVEATIEPAIEAETSTEAETEPAGTDDFSLNFDDSTFAPATASQEESQSNEQDEQGIETP
jgi:hypothetical protein